MPQINANFTGLEHIIPKGLRFATWQGVLPRRNTFSAGPGENKLL